MPPIPSFRSGQLLTQPTYSRLSNPVNHSDQDDELDATFNDPIENDHRKTSHDDDDDDDDDDDEGEEEEEEEGNQTEHQALVSQQPTAGSSRSSKMINNSSGPGKNKPTRPAYDFERDSSSNIFLSSSSSSILPSSQPPPSSSPNSTLGPPSLIKLAGMGGGVQNDGVFANLSAKPDGGRTRVNPSTGEMEYVGGNDDGQPNDKEEALPNYDTAALDSAPPYWETTVTLPGVNGGPYGLLGPDDVVVDGLPVGNLFGFAWNLLVSMSFQFIGFLLTYLLHTTHAAKNGSRAGLGITLIQYGLYTRSRALELSGGMNSADQVPGSSSYNASIPPTTTDPWGLFGPSSRSDWDGSTDRGSKGSQSMPYDGISTDHSHAPGAANEWLGYILIAIGWFLLLGGLVNYWRAVRWARAVRSDENIVGTLA